MPSSSGYHPPWVNAPDENISEADGINPVPTLPLLLYIERYAYLSCCWYILDDISIYNFPSLNTYIPCIGYNRIK